MGRQAACAAGAGGALGGAGRGWLEGRRRAGQDRRTGARATTMGAAMARGMPEEFVKVAQERFQNVQAAYEAIREREGR